MPSSNDPKSSVNSGPGKLSIGTVPASALLSPGGGSGGDLALESHINNPTDAHFAHAIGVDAYYPYPGGTEPILSRVGGPIDGESVLDFINQMMSLIPTRPNSLGFNVGSAGTSGIPSWGSLSSLLTGGYDNGGNVQFTHYVVSNGTSTTGALSGLLFPADRGVVAFYSNSSGNFLDGSSTLIAALNLGSTTIAGIPSAAFSQSLRTTQQVAYVPSGSGLDHFGLTFRYPYLSSYTGYSAPPYGPFSVNFPGFQLAEFSLPSQNIAAGGAQNFLIVHWKETYAVSLTTIQPAALLLTNLTSSNCYSAVPSSNTAYATGSWDDDTNSAFNINRHFIFRDSASGSTPTGVSFTSIPSGSFASIHLSGIPYYSSVAGGGLTWQMDVQASNLFTNSFLTGSIDSPPNVPTQFHSAFDPMQMDFSAFGGGLLALPYYDIYKQSAGSPYSSTNSPAPGDIAEYPNNTLAAVSPTAFCPAGGYGQLLLHIRNPFVSGTYTDPTKYLFDSYAQSGGSTQSTTTYEPFFDEYYRYLTSFDPTGSATVPIVPTGGNIFPSSTPFVVTGPNLQVEGGGPSRPGLCYPQVNYTSGYYPSTGSDYSGFPGGDGSLHLRRYLRAIDTGTPRNTGWVRLNGLAQAAFTQNAAYNGTETTGHTTGGAIVQIKVPGASGSDWLDLGRSYGDPGVVGSLGTSPFYGCSTGVVVNGSDIYVSYNTAAFTSSNGSGLYLLFIRVTFLNGAGTSLNLNQMQWYPPTFTPP